MRRVEERVEELGLIFEEREEAMFAIKVVSRYLSSRCTVSGLCAGEEGSLGISSVF